MTQRRAPKHVAFQRRRRGQASTDEGTGGAVDGASHGGRGEHEPCRHAATVCANVAGLGAHVCRVEAGRYVLERRSAGEQTPAAVGSALPAEPRALSFVARALAKERAALLARLALGDADRRAGRVVLGAPLPGVARREPAALSAASTAVTREPSAGPALARLRVRPALPGAWGAASVARAMRAASAALELSARPRVVPAAPCAPADWASPAGAALRDRTRGPLLDLPARDERQNQENAPHRPMVGTDPGAAQ
jgi:hypothetical protein